MREIWRLLDENEPLKPTDEYYDPYTRDWIENRSSTSHMNLAHRRRETIEDEPKWVEIDRTNNSMRVNTETVVVRNPNSFMLIGPGGIEPWGATHRLVLKWPKQSDPFETFWQANKEKLIDVSKDAARLIYEKARA